MYAQNGQHAVTIKIYGIGKPCEQAKQFTMEIRWRNSQASYQVQAGCYGGTDWAENLYYLSDRHDPNSAKEVNCANFAATYNPQGKIHRAFIPRGCIGKANNRIRVWAEGVNYADAMPGEAGPTKLLNRG
jgi:hypothetical protein